MAELTFPIKPSMPMRSRMISDEGRVGIIGEILNSTMLA
jgi:hypothetical protein